MILLKVIFIILGIFFRRVNKEGAISGMLVGISVMLFYMMKFKLGWLGDIPPKSEWWFGISPEGFGSVAMLCNFVTSITVDSIPILDLPPSIIIFNFFLNSSNTSEALTGLRLEEKFALGIANGNFKNFKRYVG